MIQEIGKIKKISPNKEGYLIEVFSTDLLTEIKIDDSIAINGVCQTATKLGDQYFEVQAVSSTLEKTSLNKLIPGQEVNLELALRLSDRLGGHLVQGHVNKMLPIQGIEWIGESAKVGIRFEPIDRKSIIEEGSITINGVSLTISEIDDEKNVLYVFVIPHTFNRTILKNLKIGEYVNIEFDLIGKYVENLFKFSNQKKDQALTLDWIRSKGF